MLRDRTNVAGSPVAGKSPGANRLLKGRVGGSTLASPARKSPRAKPKLSDRAPAHASPLALAAGSRAAFNLLSKRRPAASNNTPDIITLTANRFPGFCACSYCKPRVPVSSAAPAVERMLRSLGLEKYYQVFIDNGYDSMDYIPRDKAGLVTVTKETSMPSEDAAKLVAGVLRAGSCLSPGTGTPGSPYPASPSVREMLRSIGLGQYANAFDGAGYDDLRYIQRICADPRRLRRLTREVGMAPTDADTFVASAAQVSGLDMPHSSC